MEGYIIVGFSLFNIVLKCIFITMIIPVTNNNNNYCCLSYILISRDVDDELHFHYYI